MIGKPNSQVKPYALGLVPQTSIYGSCIPVIYGRARSALYLIWQNNLREGGSGKKLKQKKGNVKTYAINADFLLGHNPIISPLRMWKNKDVKLDLTFTVYTTTITAGVETSITIPDAAFYKVIGVTLEEAYDVTFDDFGGQGPDHQTGTFEHPLWNSANAGPDITNMSGWRHYPWVFRWIPQMGATIDLDINGKGALPSGTLRVYYAKLINSQVPVTRLNLSFEQRLGKGSEYTGYSSQQILYNAYAGLGSPGLDLGAAQALPNIVAEVLGAFPVYPSGDADYADMIEDIFKGVAQCSPDFNVTTNPAPAYVDIHHGLNCYEFPGAVQKKLRTSDSAFTTVKYDLQMSRDTTPVDSIAVVVARNDAASALSITGSQGLSYVPVSGMPNGKQVWVCYLVRDFEEVTVAPSAAHTDIELIEMKGLEGLVFQSVTTGTGSPIQATINTTIPYDTSFTIPTPPGTVIYLLAMVLGDSANVQPTQPPNHWNSLMTGVGRTFSMYRIVKTPASYTFHVEPSGYTGAWACVILGFAAWDTSNAANWLMPQWPKPLGNVLDEESFAIARRAARANGLYGSLTLDSQRKAGDVLLDLFTAMNAAPVWSGFKLKAIPWSEVSAVGNGAIYDASTVYYVVADLTARDFAGSADKPYIHIERKAQVDRKNVWQFQHPNRDSDYNEVISTDVEQSEIALHGVRKEDPKQNKAVVSVDVARKLLGITKREQNYQVNRYTFTLQARWKLLEAMDLVTLTDENLGLNQVPVRLLSISENKKYDLECEAEDWIYGVHAPIAPVVTPPSPYLPNTDNPPPNVN